MQIRKKSEIKLNFDNILGHPLKELISSHSPTIIHFDNKTSISKIVDGWCFDTFDNRAPDGGWIILKSPTDTIKLSITLFERKDVLEYYSLPFGKVGFKSSYDINLIKDGTYTLNMLLRYGRDIVEIDSLLELKIEHKTLDSFNFSVRRPEII